MPSWNDWLSARLRPWLALWSRMRPGRRPAAPPTPRSDRERAADLVAAIDAGGLPLNPMRVNAIARSLGLEVSSRAPVEETVERIRRALERDSGGN